LVIRTQVDKIIADLLRYPDWRAEVCSDPEAAIGAPQWRKLSDKEKTAVQNIACGSEFRIVDIEAELAKIDRSMKHYVTD
jgi:hypothetical protein